DQSLARLYPEDNGAITFRAVPLREHLLGDVRTPLLVLMASVGLVLLIACANVAGLMLARGARREREYALRGALGASTVRLVRQIAAESLVLAGLGCLLGTGVAYASIEIMGLLGPDHLPRIDEVRLDGPVLLFALGVSALSAVLSGISPSLRLSRPDLAVSLSDGSRSSTRGPGGLRIRNRLVVAEVAAAVVLLVGAGLLSRSFTTLLDEELGFDPTGRLAVQVFVYDGYDGPDDRAAFVRRAMEELEAIPGVRSVALTSSVPAATDGRLASIDINLPFTIADRPAPPVGREPVAAISQVSEGFFHVVDMQVVEGRSFNASDGPETASVVVVNEALARRHFGEASAVGETLIIGYRPIPREIVGVVADVRPRGYESEPRPEVYFPLSQFGTGSLTFVMASDVEAATLVQPAMQAIWEVNPAQSIWGAATLEDLLGDWLTERRFNLMLMGSLAVIALLLAGIGIYGLVSFSVEERVAEIGIRRALGGGAGSILKLVLVEGTRLAVAGLALGLILAYPLTRFIRGMLHGVEPTDPLVLAGLVVIIMGVATVAVLVPALRALRADPMRALRTE
ncbi:MAG: FtsX-like permease family protein, partial [Longimicrobiales bacterium]|nr:FtsX-like permease family protein [Longimicrobiales bacterium]